MYSAYYLAELLSELAGEYEPQPELFDAAESTLAALRIKGNAARHLLRFEMTMLRVLGHLPAFDVCAECGQPINSEQRVPFTVLDGGALCSDCRVGKKQVVSVSLAVLKTMKLFAALESNAWQHAEIQPKVHGELRSVLNKYLSHLIGHAPKMHKLLTGLAKE